MGLYKSGWVAGLPGWTGWVGWDKVEGPRMNRTGSFLVVICVLAGALRCALGFMFAIVVFAIVLCRW